MLDTRHIKKVKLVGGGNIALHLLGRHAAIALNNINSWNLEVGENIPFHRSDGHHRNQNDAQDRRYHGDRSLHCHRDDPHGLS
ncbi:MAG: hypothetical protein BWY75_01106 [bacterium ADurb.Bin425]|nr:MAG: hypothetical protein BWY75_01106 [bacterium ADurb.Bin425]